MEEKCRLCMEGIEQKQGAAIVEDEFRQMLDNVFQFPIFAEQYLPTGVCEECTVIVSNFYTYSCKVQEIQQKLLLEQYQTTQQTADSETLDKLLDHGGIDKVILDSDEEAKAAGVVAVNDSTHQDGVEPLKFHNYDTNFQLPKDAAKALELQIAESMNDQSAGASASRDPTTKPFNCNYCGFRFAEQCELKQHIEVTHVMRGKEYQCDVCHIVFNNSETLRLHKVRSHSKVRYQCKICKREFKQRVYLKEHVASHTGKPLYTCDVCGAKFTFNSNFYAHRKAKHPVEWARQRMLATGGSSSLPT